MHHIGRDFHHIAGQQLLRWLAFLLVIAAPADGNQQLAAGMAVPVVAATGFKGHIADRAVQCRVLREPGQIRLPGEEFSVGRVRLSRREYTQILRHFFLFHILCF